ncbi:hypothetical protein RBE51_18215 [Pseudomonas taiwanensis]|uniref:hypothetical protein n=1 Tax=Pseudomonas taiwanensis TaxID=470150 RepID=UPI0028E0877F|nr:hypothetical protein [Pseudomonas taiwanensis]MDT8924731.1 hypothetical protein [Pseudomonas taiwanensis]
MPDHSKKTDHDVKPLSQDFLIDIRDIKPCPEMPRVLEGELVGKNSLDSLLPGLSHLFALHNPVVEEIHLTDHWFRHHNDTPEGLEPVIADFLKEHPRYLGTNVAGALGESRACPRAWSQLSNEIHKLNRDQAVVAANGTWIAPERLLSALVGRDPAIALLDYAKSRGLNVLNQIPGISKDLKAIAPDEPGL